MEYKETPTKDDLLDYFLKRIRIRKLTERECLRLMSFSEESVDAMCNAEIVTTLKDGTEKRKKMPKTQLYKQAGNSIDCNTLRNIFRTLLIPNQPEHKKLQETPTQLTLF